MISIPFVMLFTIHVSIRSIRFHSKHSYLALSRPSVVQLVGVPELFRVAALEDRGAAR
jgi:hypothetical protein